jgi:hypothetical protein
MYDVRAVVQYQDAVYIFTGLNEVWRMWVDNLTHQVQFEKIYG